MYLFADFESGVIYGLELNGMEVIDDFQISTGKNGGQSLPSFTCFLMYLL